MNKPYSYLRNVAVGLLALCCSLPLAAQSTDNAAEQSPMILVPHGQEVSYRERTLCFAVKADVDYTVSADQDWATVRLDDNGSVWVHLEPNYYGENRVATITFTSTDGTITETLAITQRADESVLDIPANSDEYDLVFADDLYSTLKPEVTLDMIRKLENPFVQSLAMKLYNNDYETDYRVASYPCHLSPYTQSAQWAAPGKYYDQISGVTGINIPAKSTIALVVRDIPSGMTAQLKVVAWYVGVVGGNFDGGNPNTSTYNLKNGINVIDYNYDHDGLAYICYYSSDDPENHPDIRAHFVNGQINGYLSPDKTNEEMHDLCVNAPSQFMDLVGDKVHSVWTSHGLTGPDGTVYSKGLAEYCKASDGTSYGYIQYINLLDSLVAWEHRLLGLEKYGRVPDNRTMAYVNFTYYMFQGAMGVSFHVDQERRVLNCRTLMYNDSDAIWGLSHEWGHQHQMTPYFCWSGQGECTNNMNSIYNVLHMGYSAADIDRVPLRWNSARRHFFNYYTYDLGVPESRQRAYNKRTARFSWNAAILAELEKQYQEQNGFTQYPSFTDDIDHSFCIAEGNVEEHLAPFYMLYTYLSDESNAEYCKDFQQDLYESLRQNDWENGSTIEPDYVDGVAQAKTSVDKYELLARAQNNVSGAYAAFTSAYPNSVWTTQKYITSSSTYTQNSVPFIFNYVRKASKLCGYNLYPYFEKFGFFRTIIATLDDYGDKDYVMMSDMRDEFKADMEALGLKEVSDELVTAIGNVAIPTFARPEIPNTPTVR